MNAQLDAPSTENVRSDKTFTIIVNTREEIVTSKKVSFDEVVKLAFGTPDYASKAYTVTYSKGEDKKPKGSLVQGDTVNVKDGMIFDVIRTDKS